MALCLWTLLSINDLRFITISCCDHLKGYSLFQLIHPEEVSLAKRDLSKFTSTNSIEGSVTRCRLKDYTKMGFSLKTSDYIIVDIVMYVAAENLVLAFLHYNPDLPSSNAYLCGENTKNFCALTLKEALIEQSLQKAPSPSLSTVSSLSSSSVSPKSEYLSHSPHQFLYILDSQTRSVLLSWPDHYPNESISEDWMRTNNNRPWSSEVSCFRYFQRYSRISRSGQKIDNIHIQYGSIEFVIVHLEKSRRSLSLPSSPNKYNQHAEYPLYHQPPQQPQHYISRCASVSSSPPIRQRKYQPYPSIAAENYLDPMHHSNKQQQYFNFGSKHHCQSCGTESSPEWRRGPTGHKTLCNACGLRYSRSVARQGKIANQQKQYRQQQPSVFQSQNTPHFASANNNTTITTPTTATYYQGHYYQQYDKHIPSIQF